MKLYKFLFVVSVRTNSCVKLKKVTEAMNVGITVQNLTGGYTQLPVIKDVSFNVNDGELVGLIGLNGAGKSTTLKHIIGLMDPQDGEIILNEKTIKKNPETYRKEIGYIPETPVLYEELTLKEHIEVTAMAYGIDSEVAMTRAKPLLSLFRLDTRLDWFPAYFSKGMKQKVMIVCAFLINPPILVIDEPFIGLDPLGIRDILTLIQQKKEEGTAILMSTHVLSTAEKYCDRFVILHDRKVFAQGSLTELQTQFGMQGAALDDIYLALTEEEPSNES